MNRERMPLDVHAWEVEDLPAGFAERVLARVDAEREVVVPSMRRATRDRSTTRLSWIAVSAAAAAAVLLWRWPREPEVAVLPSGVTITAEDPRVAPSGVPTVAEDPHRYHFRAVVREILARATDTPDDSAGSDGSMDREAIRRGITSQFLPVARQCYDDLRRHDPSARGRVVLRFAIVAEGENGVVRDAAVAEDSEIDDATFHACLVAGLSRVVFDVAPVGRAVVHYPFVFVPTEP